MVMKLMIKSKKDTSFSPEPLLCVDMNYLVPIIQHEHTIEDREGNELPDKMDVVYEDYHSFVYFAFKEHIERKIYPRKDLSGLYLERRRIKILDIGGFRFDPVSDRYYLRME